MKIVVQNVKKASVSVDKKIVGEISHGFCLLVGFTHDDTKEIVEKMADKLLSLRIFDDENGKTNLSLDDVKGEILSVSQFTLYADVTGGRRPSFVNAMKPNEAEELYNYFNDILSLKGYHVEKGIFGAQMEVNILNDGPFTVILDSKELIR